MEWLPTWYLLMKELLPVVLACLIGVVLIAVLLIRERPNEKILPWLPGVASEHSKNMQADNLKEIFIAVGESMFKMGSIKLISILLFSSISYGIYTSVMPKLAADLVGWTTQDYSSLSGTANIVAAILCVFVFGFLANKFGRKKLIIALLLLQCMLVGYALFDQNLWSTDRFVNVGAVAVISLRYGLIVAMAAIAMSLCDLKVSATQFTLYMACSNLGLSIAYSMVGVLDKMGGYFFTIAAFTGVSVLAFLIAFSLDDR